MFPIRAAKSYDYFVIARWRSQSVRKSDRKLIRWACKRTMLPCAYRSKSCCEAKVKMLLDIVCKDTNSNLKYLLRNDFYAHFKKPGIFQLNIPRCRRSNFRYRSLLCSLTIYLAIHFQGKNLKVQFRFQEVFLYLDFSVVFSREVDTQFICITCDF